MNKQTAASATGTSVDLRVEMAGLVLKNPVMVSSGTFGYGEEYSRIYDINRLGAIVAKATTIRPKHGNPPPRVVEVVGGMLSCCGQQNVGLERFISEKLPFIRTLSVPFFANVAGEIVDDYVFIAEKLCAAGGIAALELNVSCPNLQQGGMAFGVDPAAVKEIVAAVKKISSLPVVCKLTPNVTDVVAIARAAEEAGADALSLINAPLGMAIDVETRRPKLGNVVGGLTGPAIKPLALRMVWQVAQSVSVPVIGIGGITTAEDALEFIIAGATAVQIGTANFFRPLAPLEIIAGMEDYLKKHGLDNIKELRGSLELPPARGGH
ncbi:MAG: dihydroorotate dehydrogenase [Bacillota bacterium]